MLPLLVRVDVWAVTMQGCSGFLKALTLLEPHHQIVWCHKKGIHQGFNTKTDGRFMQDGQKAVWRIPYVSVAFFPSLKKNFIAHRSSNESSRPDCIFEIHQLWQSGLSRVYYNCCCSCSFEAEIIKIGRSSQKMYSNNIVNFKRSVTNEELQQELEFILLEPDCHSWWISKMQSDTLEGRYAEKLCFG